ncbi:MAG: hypothetical protein NTX76_03570 [Alphaproteobacteria bacterium]|nr:hypothetical protein [Alphaproteobacteria bacterium]
MCFSATASFSAAALLIPTGAYCLYQSSQKNKNYSLLAAIPFLFGVQQFSEGLVWKGVEIGSQSLTMNSAYVFLFFAFFLWPFWIALSVYPITPPLYNNRKLILKVFIGIGIALGLYRYIPLPDHFPGMMI